MRRFRNAVIALLFWAVVGRLMYAQCTSLNARSSAEDLIRFLDDAKKLLRDQQNTECVSFALRQFNYKRSPEAVPVLIQYLDFQRLLTEAEQAGFSSHGGARNIADRYPASGGLVMAGKAAVPSLLSAIEAGESPVTRRNATYTIMQIYRTEPVSGILVLRQELVKSSGQAATNLKEATTTAVQWCGEEYRVACDQVAQSDKR